MSPSSLLLLLLCTAGASLSSAARLPSSAAAAAEADQAAALPLLAGTVHELLPEFGLPKGLLPASVTGYSMGDNGHFEVKLAAPCYVKFTDLVYYDRTIKGKLSYGAISDLSGIEVKKLFAWLSITGMVADGKDIVFQVGFLSEKLPASMFAEIPSCRKKASGGGVPCHDAGAGAAAAVEAA